MPLPSLAVTGGRGARPEPSAHQEPGSSLPWRAHLCSLGEGTGCTIHHLLCNSACTRMRFASQQQEYISPQLAPSPIQPGHALFATRAQHGEELCSSQRATRRQQAGGRRAREPARKGGLAGPTSALPLLSWKESHLAAFGIGSQCAKLLSIILSLKMSVPKHRWEKYCRVCHPWKKTKCTLPARYQRKPEIKSLD